MRKNKPRNTSGKKIKNHYNLPPNYNLLKAGTNLAPRINQWVEINGYPVVALNNLIKYKPKTVTGARANKLANNLRTLNKIKKAKKGENTIKRKTNWNPKVRSIIQTNGNYNTPPTTPRAH